MNRIIQLCCFVMFLACSTPQQETSKPVSVNRTEEVRAKALHYFEVYKERKDWNGFLSLFRDDMIFEDVLFDFTTHSKDTFKLFYNWEDTRFQKIAPDTPTLVVEELLVNDSMAIGKGYFPDFIWDGEVKTWADDFVICLYYDEQLKIRKQVDFIYYPDTLIKDTKKLLKDYGFIHE